MALRPAIAGKDSAGRHINILNDESTLKRPTDLRQIDPPRYTDTIDHKRRESFLMSTSPSTPSLFRSDSYDSQVHDPLSPTTPTSTSDFGRQPTYGSASAYPDPTEFENRQDSHSLFGMYPEKRSSGVWIRQPHVDHSSRSFEDDQLGDNTSDRSGQGKRYPCRFKDSHGCDKTFTTSGHASRHSKIHTAEKAVHCSFHGCQKKFTRADNMKQHLETHYKERARSSTSHKSSSSTSKLTISAGVKKGPPKILPPSRSSSRAESRSNQYDSYAPAQDDYSPLTSPISTYNGALDMGNFHRGLPTPSLAMPRHSSGLDALAAVVASQILK